MDLSPTNCLEDKPHPKDRRMVVKDGNDSYWLCPECGYGWKKEGNVITEEVHLAKMISKFKDVSPDMRRKRKVRGRPSKNKNRRP